MRLTTDSDSADRGPIEEGGGEEDKTMTTKTKKLTKKQEEAEYVRRTIERLKELIKPGDRIRASVVHVSRSGMYRVVRLYAAQVSEDGRPETVDITGMACAATGYRWDDRHGGMGIGGCGFSVTFQAVYELSYSLFPDGFICTGRSEHPNPCPSNDHFNGDRDYSPHHHAGAGYALREA